MTSPLRPRFSGFFFFINLGKLSLALSRGRRAEWPEPAGGVSGAFHTGLRVGTVEGPVGDGNFHPRRSVMT